MPSLNELIKDLTWFDEIRKLKKIFLSMPLTKAGQTTVEFDGIATVFTIEHDLGTTPSSFAVTFGDASNTNFTQSLRTIDETKITFTCTNPPIQGSQIVYWQVFNTIS